MKTVSAMILALLFTTTFTLAFYVPPVEEAGTVYIRADGSIDPLTTPISTVDNVTYILTGNIASDADGIIVERDHIVVDGSDFTVEGVGYPSRGIYLDGRNNVTIRNLSIEHFYRGILVNSSSNNSIERNDIAANDNCGIWLNDSSNNRISRNTIADNSDGIYVDSSSNYNFIEENNITNNDYYGIGLFESSNSSISGNTVAYSLHGLGLTISHSNNISRNIFIGGALLARYSYSNLVENNIVNGKPLVYLEDVTAQSVGDAGQVVLVRCNRIRVENLSLSQTSTGILLTETNNSIVYGNTITSTSMSGIGLSYSTNNSIYGNDVTSNVYNGISLSYSSNNSIISNNVANNGDCGIRLMRWSDYNIIDGNNITGSGSYGVDFEFSSNYNSISGNKIANNVFGVFLGRSSNYNGISENNVTSNVRGVYMYDSSNNTFWHNNFIENTYVLSGSNFWDNGCEGNYWSNYNGMDLDNDGVGDTLLPWEGVDNYPLMNVYWNPSDTNHDLKVDMRDIGVSAKAFGTVPGDTLWNAHADITGPESLVPDGKVDMRDIGLVARHFGEHYP